MSPDESSQPGSEEPASPIPDEPASAVPDESLHSSPNEPPHPIPDEPPDRIPDEPPDPHRTTLASYQANVERYVAGLAARPTPATSRHIKQFAKLMPAGARVLEIGSGPGRDADELEAAGLSVRRTDATPAFVERLRRLGRQADLLDVLTDPLGGPYHGIWASAVLLHLSRDQLPEVLRRCRAAVQPLACSASR